MHRRVSVCGVTPAQQMMYALPRFLGDLGYRPSVIDKALAIRAVLDDYHRGLVGLPQATDAWNTARSEPWFEKANIPGPDARAYARILDFDVRPALGKLRIRVLLIFGGRDRWVPVGDSASIWKQALGDPSLLTIEHIAEASHNMTTEYEAHDQFERGPIAARYEEILLAWIRQAFVKDDAPIGE